MPQINRQTAILHILFWIAWAGTSVLVNFIMGAQINYLSLGINVFTSISWFYFFQGIILKNVFGETKKGLRTALLIPLFFPVFHYIRFGLDQWRAGSFDPQSFWFDRIGIGMSMAFFIQYSIFAVSYSYFLFSIERRNRIQELELNNQQLHIQQLLTEYNFLKAQINPHFLYNTLNTLFSHAQKYSDELANNILKLSEIMRYSMDGLEKENGLVNLKDEIHYIHNLIDIHQLRFSNELHIDFTVSGSVGDFRIPPLTFITFVENALKYGEIKNQERPLRIRLDAMPDKIYFYCHNRKKKKVIEKSSGIGIQNVLKRLDVSYLGKYEVKIKNEEDDYTLELTLNV